MSKTETKICTKFTFAKKKKSTLQIKTSFVSF